MNHRAGAKLRSETQGLGTRVGFLGRGSEPPSHQLGVCENAVSSPSRVRGGEFEIRCNLRPQQSLHNYNLIKI